VDFGEVRPAPEHLAVLARGGGALASPLEVERELEAGLSLFGDGGRLDEGMLDRPPGEHRRPPPALEARSEAMRPSPSIPEGR
jgi:hypothetical protein